jgi:hypothetical protein
LRITKSNIDREIFPHKQIINKPSLIYTELPIVKRGPKRFIMLISIIKPWQKTLGLT